MDIIEGRPSLRLILEFICPKVDHMISDPRSQGVPLEGERSKRIGSLEYTIQIELDPAQGTVNKGVSYKVDVLESSIKTGARMQITTPPLPGEG